jgi:hypothetical protein
MTEQEWLAGSNCLDLIMFLRQQAGRTVNDRKWRLFVCACCRGIWELLSDERSRKAVEAGEQFADRLLSPHDLARVDVQAMAVLDEIAEGTVDAFKAASAAGVATAEVVGSGGAAYVSTCAVDAVFRRDRWSLALTICSLLRDIFGNPFRPVKINSAWRTSTVTALAQAIYQDRAFDRLPILADALEDAGCTNADILGHCRGPGPHVLGCWVVDLLLGKE